MKVIDRADKKCRQPSLDGLESFTLAAESARLCHSDQSAQSADVDLPVHKGLTQAMFHYVAPRDIHLGLQRCVHSVPSTG